MGKKISVIMGIYNCESTLREAIDSIIAQTEANWELIMCDDGSIDQTFVVAQEYAHKFPEKIVIIRNEKNLGLNATLNYCLKYATGKYVARMDGDDISLPDRLEKESEFLDSHSEYAIVSTPMIYFDESGDWGQSKLIEKPSKKDFIKHSPVHCHAPCMIRREAYEAVGGYTVDKRILRFEDVNLWYKLYAAGYQGYNLSEPLYKMRDDQNAVHRRSFSSRLNGVYVMYIGFKMFKFPAYTYIYVLRDLFRHTVKSLLPEIVYIYLHKKKRNK